MNLTIIPSDDAVYIDGVCVTGIPLSEMFAGIHAVQWYDTYGSVEFSCSHDDEKQPNQSITELTTNMLSAVELYTQKVAEDARLKAEADAAIAAAVATSRAKTEIPTV